MIYYINIKQSKAKQSKAKQSHNCLLNNYLKFLFQKYFFNLVKSFLTSINFLSAFIRLAKIFSFIKEKQNLCSFLITKKNHAKGGQSSKITSFCQKEAKTTPFRIRNSLVKTFSQYSESPSLRVGLKPVFDERSNLFGVDCHADKSARNDKFKIYNDNKNKLVRKLI